MAAISAEAIPAFLKQLSGKLQRPCAAHLLPTVVSLATGHGPEWIGPIYRHAVADLPPAPSTRSNSPQYPTDDPIPRRRVVRELKEALMKSAVLVGVPKAIETALHLRDEVEEGAKDDSFVREELVTLNAAEVRRRGNAGLGAVYQEDIGPIFEMMELDLKDIRKFCRFGRGISASEYISLSTSTQVGCQSRSPMDRFSLSTRPLPRLEILSLMSRHC